MSMPLQTAFARVFPGEEYPGEEAACEFLVAEILMNRDIAADPKTGPMRSFRDISHAHDSITGILVDEEIREVIHDDGVLQDMMARASVLCWVLKHDHNLQFTEWLGNVRKLVHAMGLAMVPDEEGRTR